MADYGRRSARRKKAAPDRQSPERQSPERQSAWQYDRTTGRNTLRSNTEASPEKRRRRNQRQKKNNGSRVLVVILFLAVLIGLGGLGLKMLFGKNALLVTVGTQEVGKVKNSKEMTVDYLTTTVSAQLEEQVKSKVQMNETIGLTPVKAPKKELVTGDYILAQIRSSMTYKVDAALISANGAQVAILPNVEEAQKMLEDIRNEYVPEGAQMETSFVEDVQVASQFVDSKEIMTYEQAVQRFTQGTKIEKPYTVVTGDTMSKVAGLYGMTVEELIEKNPDLTPLSQIKIGQTLTVTQEKPFISVKTVESSVYTEVEKKKVEYQYDDTKAKRYQKVVQQGKDGQKQVTVNIIRINGFEEERVIVSESILQEPVAEIIAVGTQ